MLITLPCKRCHKKFFYDYKAYDEKPELCPECSAKVDEQEMLSDSDFATRIENLLCELDTIRVNMCALATEMHSYQSFYDKADQTFLHKIENMKADDPIEAQTLIEEWQASRKSRRNIKDLLQILTGTIAVIPYKNRAKALPILKSAETKEFKIN